jgi:glyoxylase-like metal-dependent hydrolase (beta-lactamase superfamily II)
VIKIRSYDEITRFELAHTLPVRWRYWTTAYLVDGMMVDTGCAHTAPELLAALADREPVSRIVNTHTHEDHIGANGDLQAQNRGLEISAHPLAMPVLADPRGVYLQPYRRVFWGWPKPCRAGPLADGAEVETERHRFRVVYTPGHTPDHICLYEPETGWLFTGDLFVGGQERALGAGYDIWQIVASLKRIAVLPASRLFPASAQVREDPQRELDTKIAYLEELGGRVLDLHRRGWGTGAIVRAVCGRPMQVELITLGHFSRKRMVLSFLKKVNAEGGAPAGVVR